jgi:threonine/homoserine/homoserine lactone efflux protein
MAAIIAPFGNNALHSAARVGRTRVVNPNSALLAGLVAGLAIATQVGPVSLLLVETAVATGPRRGVAAGMGVAAADLGFATAAAATGGAVSAALASHEAEIRGGAALVLAAIALHGLVGLARERRRPGGAAAPAAPRADAGARAGAQFARFLAITAANPLTIASFAAVTAALSLPGLAAAAAFVVGVGAASAAWHLLLTLAAGHAARWLTPAARHALAIGGRLAVLAIAAHLALRG